MTEKNVQEKEYSTIYAILENGDSVKIICGDNMFDNGLYDSLVECIKSGKLFNQEGWNDLTMEYRDEKINLLNTDKIIGLVN